MPNRFLTSLLSSPAPVIMEIKRRDGHGEELLGRRSLGELVSAYHGAGAPCLSVVTGRWFGGSDNLLRSVAPLTSLPVLKKDFIASERQIVEAKAMGASALLLTAAILRGKALARLIEKTLRHGLTPFVEATSERELEAVTHGRDCVVAINNKDIRNRERAGPDLDRSLALLEPALATGTLCTVSASGIDSPQVAASLVSAGFRGVLVGRGLLRAVSVQSWIDDFEHDLRSGGSPSVAERHRC